MLLFPAAILFKNLEKNDNKESFLLTRKDFSVVRLLLMKLGIPAG
jgi:hypothetical protein